MRRWNQRRRPRRVPERSGQLRARQDTPREAFGRRRTMLEFVRRRGGSREFDRQESTSLIAYCEFLNSCPKLDRSRCETECEMARNFSPLEAKERPPGRAAGCIALPSRHADGTRPWVDRIALAASILGLSARQHRAESARHVSRQHPRREPPKCARRIVRSLSPEDHTRGILVERKGNPGWARR